jgi:hypothetical protein
MARLVFVSCATSTISPWLSTNVRARSSCQRRLSSGDWLSSVEVRA